MTSKKIDLREAIESLTRAQYRVYEYIVQHAMQYGSPPTLREVANELGLPVSSVFYHKETLIRKGVLLPGHGYRPYEITGLELYIDYETIVEVEENHDDASETLPDQRQRHSAGGYSE